jgi:hypothetical protein
MANKLQVIREKCIEANPEIKSDLMECPECRLAVFWDGSRVLKQRPIRLADVLLAIGNMLIVVDAEGNFYRLKMMLNWKVPRITKDSHLGKWNLRADDLSQQSPETVDFIYSLLS